MYLAPGLGNPAFTGLCSILANEIAQHYCKQPPRARNVRIVSTRLCHGLLLMPCRNPPRLMLLLMPIRPAQLLTLRGGGGSSDCCNGV